MAADRRGAARRSGYDPDCWDAEGGDNCWHPTDDNLAGTASYGTDGPKYDLTPQVRKTPSWPRSWANFSL